MTNTTEERTPAFEAVWREQLHITGLSIRREAVLAGAALVLFCVAGVAFARVPLLSTLMDDELANFRLDPGTPGFGLWGVFAALLFPLVVWKGERPWGDTPIWSLPVDHRRHSLAKVAAGWVWLMGILASALLCVVFATLIGGGQLGVDEARQLIMDREGFFAGVPSTTRSVGWTTPWWEWMLPFTSATAAYMLASALLLATAHPFRWALALWVLSTPLIGIPYELEIDWVRWGVDHVAWFVGGEDFVRGTRLPSGEFVSGWLLMPSMRMWVGSAVFWISLGFACVLTASARVRDH